MSIHTPTEVDAYGSVEQLFDSASVWIRVHFTFLPSSAHYGLLIDSFNGKVQIALLRV